MSNVIMIQVADHRRPDLETACYVCGTRFELDSWVLWFWKSIPKEARKIPDRSVRAAWSSNIEVRSLEWLTKYPGEIEMVEARYLKALRFHDDDWHPERVARSKAISAFLKELPDDWPCFVYET